MEIFLIFVSDEVAKGAWKLNVNNLMALCQMLVVRLSLDAHPTELAVFKSSFIIVFLLTLAFLFI